MTITLVDASARVKNADSFFGQKFPDGSHGLPQIFRAIEGRLHEVKAALYPGEPFEDSQIESDLINIIKALEQRQIGPVSIGAAMRMALCLWPARRYLEDYMKMAQKESVAPPSSDATPKSRNI